MVLVHLIRIISIRSIPYTGVGTYQIENGISCRRDVMLVPVFLDPAHSNRGFDDCDNPLACAITTKTNLTHRNNVSAGVIHATIILGGPIEADVQPRFEAGLIIPKFFPSRHK